VVGVLGTIALWLAAIGIAGLVAYTVTLRRREIGIRLAIGAGRRHVVRAVVGQFGVPLATGLVLGFAIAWGVAQVLRGELFGLGALDPISYGGAAALFVLVAGLAALGPVGRALRIDPVTTLRAE
jgi:ABC-type antimicrobial peptide transport system permease subunit